MFIYGNRLFGKVDQVPGLGHVATRFFHIDYIPLIPSQTWLVFQQTGKSWKGIRVPMSAKSVLLAWLRTASVVFGVGSVIGLLLAYNSGRTNPMDLMGYIAVIVISWGLFAFSRLHKSVTRASYGRACQLAKLAKLSDSGLATLAKAYGQPPITYGFAPKLNASAQEVAQLAIESDEVEAIPVEELEGESSEPEPVAPIGASVSRGETRRHG